MKSKSIKKVFLSSILLGSLFLASCGANFNTIGIKMGNILNGSEYTNQGNVDYFIEEDGIYKDGEKILDGDYSNINVMGEKIYFYHNGERKVVKASTDGFKIQKIGEIYTDKFVTIKDNVLASILIGSGSEDLEAPSNYNIVKMKITDKKVTSQAPKVIYEGGKLIGAHGDKIYFFKEDKDKGYALGSVYLDGGNEKTITSLNKDARVIVSDEKIYVLGTTDEGYALTEMNLDGSKKKLLVTLGKNPDGSNAFNIDGDKVYVESYSENQGKVANNLKVLNLSDNSFENVIERDKRTDFKVSIGSKDVYIKEKAHDDLDTVVKWTKLKDIK